MQSDKRFEIDGEWRSAEYHVGDLNGVMSLQDIQDARTTFRDEDDEILRIYANDHAFRDLEGLQKFKHEQDLILADSMANVSLRLWWFRKEMGSPDGVILDIPVFYEEFTDGCSAFAVGREMNMFIDG